MHVATPMEQAYRSPNQLRTILANLMLTKVTHNIIWVYSNDIGTVLDCAKKGKPCIPHEIALLIVLQSAVHAQSHTNIKF